MEELSEEEEDEETDEDDDDEDFFPAVVHPEPPAPIAEEKEVDYDDPGTPARRRVATDLMTEIEGPVTPSAKIQDRMQQIRDKCVRDLGAALFEQVYFFLNAKLWEPEDAGLEVGGEGYEDDSVIDFTLQEMLGARTKEYRDLIEKLLLMEHSY